MRFFASAEGLATLFAVAFMLVGFLVYEQRKRKRQRRDARAAEEAVEKNIHQPATLHPVIDPDICIGSLSCINACPEGDILGIVDGTARLIVGANCIGHGRCAVECPVGAIRLVFGTSERGIDLPEITSEFESSRPGIYIVGELGGMGLIKNAMTQGIQASRFIREHLGNTDTSMLDVVIVGAGPAGIATALGCREAGVSFRILDQGTLGGTIAHYPRQKVVMTETVQLPLLGKFGKNKISKEELLRTFERARQKGNFSIDENVKVLAIDGYDGDFRVVTNRGDLPTRKVVLAVGRRGTPRKLDVPGEELPKVSYRLIDPEQYVGSRVLVVGGGDSALESAILLAEQGQIEVTLSYRGDAFGKCRQENRLKLGSLEFDGRIRVLLGSQVVFISEQTVTLATSEGEMEIDNDFVIVNAGGELPTQFLQQLDIQMVRHHGEIDQPSPTMMARETEEQSSRLLVTVLTVLGVLIFGTLAFIGKDYYLLSRAERLHSPDHTALRSSGLIGHGIGIVATLFMMTNFFYAMRKRWRLLKGTGSIRSWLTVHMFIGFMSPLVIAFHATFQSNNHLATATYVSLLIVVSTGLFGRFIYGLVPTTGGKAIELGTLLGYWERHQRHFSSLLGNLTNPGPVADFIAEVSAPVPVGGSLLRHLLAMPATWARRQQGLLHARRFFMNRDDFDEFQVEVVRLERLRTQIGFYRSLRRFLSSWRVLHVVLSVFLVFLIVAHIGVSLFLGYKWVF